MTFFSFCIFEYLRLFPLNSRRPMTETIMTKCREIISSDFQKKFKNEEKYKLNGLRFTCFIIILSISYIIRQNKRNLELSFKPNELPIWDKCFLLTIDEFLIHIERDVLSLVTVFIATFRSTKWPSSGNYHLKWENKKF